MIVKFEAGKFFLFLILSIVLHTVIFIGIPNNDVKGVKNTYFTVEIKQKNIVKKLSMLKDKKPQKKSEKIVNSNETDAKKRNISQEKLKNEMKIEKKVKKDVKILKEEFVLSKSENQNDKKDNSDLLKNKNREKTDYKALNETTRQKVYFEDNQLGNVKDFGYKRVKALGKISDFDLEEYTEYVKDFLQKSIKYPYLARRRNIQGALLLEIVVGEDGKTIDCKVLKSSGFLILDENAIETVKGVVFPKKPEDKVTLKFNLEYRLN